MIDQSHSSRTPTEEPLRVTHSKTEFVLFGNENRRNTIYVKSETAPLELIGAYPIEDVENEVGVKRRHLFGLRRRTWHWVSSLPIVYSSDGAEKGRLLLIWEGLATEADRRKIKRALDENAVDIKSAVLRRDLWLTTMAISSVIFQCRIAHQKNRRLQHLLWATSVTCLGLVVAFLLGLYRY